MVRGARTCVSAYLAAAALDTVLLLCACIDSCEKMQPVGVDSLPYRDGGTPEAEVQRHSRRLALEARLVNAGGCHAVAFHCMLLTEPFRDASSVSCHAVVGQINRGRQRRFCELTTKGELVYYKDDKRKARKGSILLSTRVSGCAACLSGAHYLALTTKSCCVVHSKVIDVYFPHTNDGQLIVDTAGGGVVLDIITVCTQVPT